MIDYILLDIADERRRQVNKWGVQHHPDGTVREGDAEIEAAAKQLTDEASVAGTVTWRDIFLEEVCEALNAEGDHLVVELVQCAAVAVAWIEDMRGSGRAL